jgi:hypothetical protein
MATVTHIQRDWEQREFIAEMTTNVKKLVDFLNNFGAPALERSRFAHTLLLRTDHSTRYRLATLRERLATMEQQVLCEWAACGFVHWRSDDTRRVRSHRTSAQHRRRRRVSGCTGA